MRLYYVVKSMSDELKIIISGGGTGGHIFPALSIANAIRAKCPNSQILFVGANGRMEMQRVPEAGYPIKGLPIAGFNRKKILKNISVLYKLLKCRSLSRDIIRDFQPQVVVGVGGYASGPILYAAQKKGLPTLIQEQNSYAGVTNKILAQKALKICVAYEGMERFFPSEKILLTGNPVRQDLNDNTMPKDSAIRSFGLVPGKRTILIIGGSLGARTINESILGNLPLIKQQKQIQFVWQTGGFYYSDIQAELKRRGCPTNMFVTDFITEIKTAYIASDLVISRAGAGSISEFCLLRKPVILIPSPNVAEDHQTKNALALVQKEAALYVVDAEAHHTLLPLAINVVSDHDKLESLSRNIGQLARPYAASDIAAEIIKLAEKKHIS